MSGGVEAGRSAVRRRRTTAYVVFWIGFAIGVGAAYQGAAALADG